MNTANKEKSHINVLQEGIENLFLLLIDLTRHRTYSSSFTATCYIYAFNTARNLKVAKSLASIRTVFLLFHEKKLYADTKKNVISQSSIIINYFILLAASTIEKMNSMAKHRRLEYLTLTQTGACFHKICWQYQRGEKMKGY